ncbi:MAG: hypothetical protein Q8R60_19935 [Mycobacteriales bacterium]|nr:hypothetical protein [Mycobacteriales bacterium]
MGARALDPDAAASDLGYLEPDDRLAAAVGVLSARRAGADARTRRAVRAGLWRRYGAVVVMHNGPLTQEQVLWVALLRSPRGVVLSGTSAAIARGLRRDAPVRPQLLVPAAGPLPHLADVDVTRTRLLDAKDVHPTAQPPQLRLSRAVVDAASRVRDADDVRALLCAPVQQRLLRPDHLREVVVRLGPVRHRALMLSTLADLAGGAHSVRELAFTRLLRRGKVPQPDRQGVRQRPSGRYFLDAEWEKYALRAEVDGLGHLGVVQWGQDCDRDNELELDKVQQRRLRIPGFWLDERPDHVLDQVRRGLRRGGWQDGR